MFANLTLSEGVLKGPCILVDAQKISGHVGCTMYSLLDQNALGRPLHSTNHDARAERGWR